MSQRPTSRCRKPQSSGAHRRGPYRQGNRRTATPGDSGSPSAPKSVATTEASCPAVVSARAKPGTVVQGRPPEPLPKGWEHQHVGRPVRGLEARLVQETQLMNVPLDAQRGGKGALRRRQWFPDFEEHGSAPHARPTKPSKGAKQSLEI